MTRTEIARFIKTKSKNAQREFIKRATIEEIVKGLDINDWELAHMADDYLENLDYDLSRKEVDAIVEATEKAYKQNCKYPTYEYMDGDKMVLRSRTRYDFIVYYVFDGKKNLYYRGNDERKVQKALRYRDDLRVITEAGRVAKLDKRFEGYGA